MTRLVFLHTSPVHVQPFDALLRELRPNTRARHIVRTDLLAKAMSLGASAPAVRDDVLHAVTEANSVGDVVLCTCSTIGGVAEDVGGDLSARVLRVDRPMAQAALEHGPKVVIAAAVASTVEPTRSLLRSVAAERAQTIHLESALIEGAWALFEAGDIDGYHLCVANGLRQVRNADVIVLAQASMAGATTHLARFPVPVLSSPELGVRGALSWLFGTPDPERPSADDEQRRRSNNHSGNDNDNGDKCA